MKAFSPGYFLRTMRQRLRTLKPRLFRCLKNSSAGGALVEFAIAISILTMLMYFSLDYYKYYFLKAKTRNAAFSAVSLIQAVSQDRPSKAITSEDLSRILPVAFMNYYKGKQGLGVGSPYQYAHGHTPHLNITLVQGLGGTRAKILWKMRLFNKGVKVRVDDVDIEVNPQQELPTALTGINAWSGENEATAIHPNLKIENGEYKVIITLCFLADEPRFKYLDGTYVSNSNAQKLFGFYGFPFEPLQAEYQGRRVAAMFPYTVIFSPHPGVFTDTPPVQR
ncbi:MAG: hypothetical protein LBJ16_02315 [Holosporaceae bacterium]|jgi:hypothetical protein|nr:hypothetical protein [Holosporaceae bacterium]